MIEARVVIGQVNKGQGNSIERVRKKSVDMSVIMKKSLTSLKDRWRSLGRPVKTEKVVGHIRRPDKGIVRV